MYNDDEDMVNDTGVAQVAQQHLEPSLDYKPISNPQQLGSDPTKNGQMTAHNNIYISFYIHLIYIHLVLAYDYHMYYFLYLLHNGIIHKNFCCTRLVIEDSRLVISISNSLEHSNCKTLKKYKRLTLQTFDTTFFSSELALLELLQVINTSLVNTYTIKYNFVYSLTLPGEITK